MSPVYIGWTYAVRNWRRNILPILIVGLAGFMVVYSLFVTTGKPYQAHLERRAYAGGDLLVFASTLSVPEHGSYLAGDAPLFSWNDPALLSPLAGLSVDSFRSGVTRTSANAIALEDLQQKLAAQPNVSLVEPVYVLPAFIADGERRLPVVLRLRDWSSRPYSDFIEVAPDVDDGVILPGFRPEVRGTGREAEGYLRFNGQVVGFYRGQPVAADWEPWQPGQEISLLLPSPGGTQWNLVDTVETTVPVKGFFEFPTGLNNWYASGLRLEGLTSQVERPPDPDPAVYPSEQLSFVPLEVSVGPSLWDELTQTAGLDPRPVALAVSLRNLAKLDVTVQELREAIAPAPLFDVVELANQEAASGTAYITVPLGDIRSTWGHQHHLPLPSLPQMPDWVRNMILVLVCTLATILAGGILDIVIVEQRREYIMLRVMGYSRTQLTTAVFSQLWCLVLFGLGVTLLTVLFPVMWQANQPGLSKLEVLAVPLKLVTVLAGGGFCISLVLTANAVRRLLARPMWEVLRS